ncbi:membrane protein [Youhaiella tibetensis]|uniref:Uncharacterized protein n=1 Tax=Paradevosia tibetensis TaxID=1447062 RepID=A0A5B9DSG5_9HYPH|nr:alpha/beta-hydrolase family protein [Youhaiella tibetensis]AKR56239.1 putative membrane protein (DUF2319) [Devosia sp. H5989]QEE21294.1 hypothetical protein FNA67_14360 [Youhaiella tibetensis]GGF16223.1 membrane protein [Youhaiella tibetensis]
MASLIKRFRATLSTPGLLIGTLLFALSLTPSLLPRDFVLQGILSGASFAIGYGIGALGGWLWEYMELKLPPGRVSLIIKLSAAVLCIVVALISLYLNTGWQNSVRKVMDMPPVESAHPINVALVAIVPAVLLIAIGSIIAYGVSLVSRWLRRYVPQRVAFVISIVIVGVLTAYLFNGLLLRNALRAADTFFERLDALQFQMNPTPAPTDPLASGSSASLVAWDTIGRDGRVYVETGPSKEKIQEVIGRPAMQPLRVYVGLRSAPTLEQRAQMALDELKRVGGFERSVLVVIMPVGTGWVDPPAVDTLEYLQAGDVASVALQYSYLTSPLSFVIEPTYGTDAAQALFKAVYDYWTTLPRDHRPKLYLHGLSLGTLASQGSTELYDVLGDPYQGALWAGPPFSSPTWSWATANREPGSPEWLPRFRNGASIRFNNQTNAVDIPGAKWGPMRIVFLQYASDPVVFFSYDAFYRRPAWLEGERGPDVSPDLAWYPVVTFLQLALDMALSQTSPMGHGHVYAPRDYIDCWVSILDPPGWDKASIDALKKTLEPLYTSPGQA